MATFFNQASISYGGYVTNSNLTSGEVLDTLAVTKTAISTGYGLSSGVVYAISLVNSGTAPIGGITARWLRLPPSRQARLSPSRE